ncbi:MAG: hypothetical protein RR185_00185 [Angelakisella sp.]
MALVIAISFPLALIASIVGVAVASEADVGDSGEADVGEADVLQATIDNTSVAVSSSVRNFFIILLSSFVFLVYYGLIIFEFLFVVNEYLCISVKIGYQHIFIGDRFALLCIIPNIIIYSVFLYVMCCNLAYCMYNYLYYNN